MIIVFQAVGVIFVGMAIAVVTYARYRHNLHLQLSYYNAAAAPTEENKMTRIKSAIEVYVFKRILVLFEDMRLSNPIRSMGLFCAISLLKCH